jgi:hypothetical protein
LASLPQHITIHLEGTQTYTWQRAGSPTGVHGPGPHRFNHALQDHSKKVMDQVSPSLRGRLAYEVHSAWICNLQVFEGCDNLPDELFINIAVILKERVFAPFEVLFEPDDQADSIFVINSGVVMSKGLSLVVRGQTLGDDALFAWRNQLSRGYQATSLSQGRTYMMAAQDILEILHRKQFVEYVTVPLKRISDGKCRHLLKSFACSAYEAAFKDTIDEAIETLLTELNTVSPTVLAGCVGLMLRLHFRCKSLAYDHDALSWRLDRMDDVSPVFAKQIVGQMREMDQAATQWKSEHKAKEKSLVRFSGPSALCRVCSPRLSQRRRCHSATPLTESTRWAAQASRTFEELAGFGRGLAEEADGDQRVSVMLNRKIRRSTLDPSQLEVQMTHLDTMREKLAGWGLVRV